ncbi:MAG: hypothetical protein JKY65_26905 [Planctomycetes bacterium]|nr:hypothetical protein [Planctomycetota bacterium]
MALEYVGGVPDWCGEAANRQRLEAWYAGFGAEGIPCPVCRTRKLSADFRRLASHLAAGKEQVTLKPAGPKQRGRTWSVSLLSSPAAVIGGAPSQALEIVHLQLTCSRCCHVLLFDAKAVGIAV